MRTLMAVLALCLSVSGSLAPANAEDVNKAIIAYNEAKSSADLSARLDAAKALGEAALANPEREDAPILAFEAGQTLCLTGDCESAQPFADWLSTQANTGLPPGDIGLLQAYASWQVKKNSRTRESFDEALIAFGTDPSLLSVAAYQARYMHDLAKARWQRATQTAQAAANHFEPVVNMVPTQWADAKIAAVSSQFNAKPNEETLYEMARLRWDFSRRWRLNQNRDAVYTARFRAEAWQLAMEAYFASEYRSKRKSDEINDTVADILDQDLPEFVGKEVDIENTDSFEISLPLCEGEFINPKPLQYPFRAAGNGLIGAVIMSFDLKDGRPVNIETKASVPYATFEKPVREYIERRRYEVTSGEPGVTCGIDRKNIVEPYIFQMPK